MEKIHIFTDSSADIPPEQVEAYGIEIVPISICCDGRVLQEFFDITPEQYWKLLTASKEIPTTAQITPHQFLQTFRRAHERGCTHVLGILINAKGSGTFQSACVARGMFYDEFGKAMHIELLDSQTYTYIYGHIVVHAAKLRDAGDSFDAILSVVNSRLNRIEAYLGVYELTHLKRSGRISGGAAFVGEALGLKPISHVCAGEVRVCDKVRGEKALIAGLARKISEACIQPDRQSALLLHGDVTPARIAELERRLMTEMGFMGVIRCPIGASVITNTGPLALAVAFYGRARTQSHW